jgi:hypothetical protein
MSSSKALADGSDRGWEYPMLKRSSKYPQNLILGYAGAKGEVLFCQAAFSTHGKAVVIGLKSPALLRVIHRTAGSFGHGPVQ